MIRISYVTAAIRDKLLIGNKNKKFTVIIFLVDTQKNDVKSASSRNLLLSWRGQEDLPSS